MKNDQLTCKQTVMVTTSLAATSASKCNIVHSETYKLTSYFCLSLHQTRLAGKGITFSACPFAQARL